MKLSALIAGAALAAFIATGPALAAPSNEDEPSGHVILDLNGSPINGTYVQFFANFTATDASTNISFAMREDPAFIFLDDVAVNDLTNPGGNLIVNGGFEAGPVGASAPTNWTYLNTFGASFGGVVENNAFIANGAHSGDNYYYDGAVQAYDGITQNIATTVGDTYQVSFWMFDNSGGDIYRRISTNGDVTDTGGNGINLVVYAGGVPVGVPEPSTWAMMILGLGGIGATIRRKSRKAGFAAA
jgi:hypothetical protein